MTNDNLIEASIHEIDGPYFLVKLQSIPAKGDLIDFFSFVDANEPSHGKYRYEVVQIVHYIHDLSEKTGNFVDGAQAVRIYVKKTVSEFFE